MRGERAKSDDIIIGAILTVLVGAEVDANDAGLAGARRQPGMGKLDAFGVEAEAVDDRAILNQPEQPGAVLALMELLQACLM
jgi:hypothetical protein